jgi:hypothetical protein
MILLKSMLFHFSFLNVWSHFLHMFQDEPFVPFTDEDEDSVDHALGGRNRFGSLSSLHKQ